MTARIACTDRLTALVHSWRDSLARVARAEGLAGEDAFDVVQEAFCAFLAMESQPADEQAGRTLVAITRNLARNRRRLHSVARPHVAPDELTDERSTAEEALIATEDQERLACCMGRLADVQRAVVTLRMFDELPGRDVAEQLGVSPGHVAVLLHRAKAALVTCLAT